VDGGAFLTAFFYVSLITTKEVNEMESADEIVIFCNGSIEDDETDATQQLAGKASLRRICYQTSD